MKTMSKIASIAALIATIFIYTGCSGELPEITTEQIKKDLSGEKFRGNSSSKPIEIEEKDILEITVEGTKVDKESKTAEKIVKVQAQKKEADPFMGDYELTLFKLETKFKLNYSYYDTGWKLENKTYDNVEFKETKTGEFLPFPEYKLNNTELKNILEAPSDIGFEYYINIVDDTFKIGDNMPSTITFQKGTIKSLEILDIKDDFKEGKKNIKVKIKFESKAEQYKGEGTALIEIPYSHTEKKWGLAGLRVTANKEDMIVEKM